MTVMFRAASVARSRVHAILTPTTRGIRAALDADGMITVLFAVINVEIKIGRLVL